MSAAVTLLTWPSPRSVRRAVCVRDGILRFFFKIAQIVQWQSDPGPQVRRSHAASLKGPLVVRPGNEIEKGPVSEFQTRPVYFHTGDLQQLFYAVPRDARKAGGRALFRIVVALFVLLYLNFSALQPGSAHLLPWAGFFRTSHLFS